MGEKLIKSKERVQRFGEVFTPQRIVNLMLDELQAETPTCFLPEKTYLEPSCGEGAFVLEILRRKFARCNSRMDLSTVLESVYAMDIQADNVEITISNILDLCNMYFKPTKADVETVNNHVILCDSLKVMRMMQDKRLQKEGRDA